jgi:hypothetical protein
MPLNLSRREWRWREAGVPYWHFKPAGDAQPVGYFAGIKSNLPEDSS